MNRSFLAAAAALCLAFAFGAGRLSAKPASVDTKSLARHVKKAFSLSPLWKVNVSSLKPSLFPGYSKGTLTIEAPQGRQDQPIFISDDGRWYFVGAAYDLEDSPVPGFKKLKPAAGSPPPPELNVSADGRFAILAPAQDLRVDPDAERMSKMKLTGVPSIGPKNAPLTLVEYSDLQCPHCKRSHDILKKNMSAYKGKVRRIFKNYPLTHIHPWAYRAALGLACAGKLSAKSAPAFKAGVFDLQETISTETRGKRGLELHFVVDKHLKGVAKKTGLPYGKFSTCLDKEEAKALVDADIAEGDRLGVQGTPTIFVNGRRARGYEWPEIRALLDAAQNN
jgi:protein-disulfide isomerase